MPPDQVTTLLVLSVGLSGEAADEVSSNNHMRHLRLEEVSHFVELLSRIFSVHVIQHVVRPTLHWHMQELVHSRVLHNVSHSLQVL